MRLNVHYGVKLCDFLKKTKGKYNTIVIRRTLLYLV